MPSLPSLIGRFIAFSCLSISYLGFAQSPILPKLDDKSPPQKPNQTATTDLTPQQKFEKLLKETNDLIHRLEVDPPTQGIDPAEVDTRKSLLDQSTFILRNCLKDLNEQADLQKKLLSATENESNWHGFTDPAPFSILLLDQLINERDAIQANLDSLVVKLTNLNNLQTSAYSEAKNCENDLGQAASTLEKADSASKPVAQWRFNATKERFTLHNLRIQSTSSQISSINLALDAARINLKLSERKIAAIRHQVEFSDADLTKILKNRDDRKAALTKEAQTTSKRLPIAMANRDKANSELLTLKEKSPPNPQAIELAEAKLAAAEDLATTIQYTKETLELLKQLENTQAEIYQYRKNRLSQKPTDTKNTPVDELKSKLAWLLSIKNGLNNEPPTHAAALRKIEARQANIAPTSPEFSLLNEQRALINERIAILDRATKATENQITLCSRWINDFSTPQEPSQSTVSQTAQTFLQTSLVWIKKGWNFKISEFKEFSMEVDGKTITKTSEFTLGMLIKAILFFAIGYAILTKTFRRMESILIHRGLIADTQASTLRNWAMIIASSFLLIGTFSLLNIPLTVFAFLGGALAIGLGFGTQTIIKNFISGIILLVERKVRVGDILEVDGFIGKVTEINTRSSVLRSGDDLETIVPNSVFLENRVTNWTLTSPKIRRTLQIGVAYGTPPQVMIDLLTESADRHGLICKDPAPFAILNDFADNALIFQLYYWLDLRSAASNIIVASDLRLMIEKRLADLDISVPYPQRNLHLNTEKPIQVTWAPTDAPNASDAPTP